MKPGIPRANSDIRPLTLLLWGLCCLLSVGWGWAQTPRLDGTFPLENGDDLSARMVAGIHRYLDQRIERERRIRHDRARVIFGAEPERRALGIAKLRETFEVAIGAVDPLEESRIRWRAELNRSSVLARSDRWTARWVDWSAFGDVSGEGILVEPLGDVIANLVILPDADASPERFLGLDDSDGSQALALADLGIRLVVPTLINRSSEFSGVDAFGISTDLSHREWIYRMAFELGRHVIGYETQKVRALAGAMIELDGGAIPICVAGYGEGGLLALCAAALDERIDAALVSGYFGPREDVWREPIYRNVQGLLTAFGDAELAGMMGSRPLIVEYSLAPSVSPSERERSGVRRIAAPGEIRTPVFVAVEKEVRRARTYRQMDGESAIDFVHENGDPVSTPFSRPAMERLLARALPDREAISAPDSTSTFVRESSPDSERMERQVSQLVAHTQRLLRDCEFDRYDTFWNPLSDAMESAETWATATESRRHEFWNEVIGRFPDPNSPMRPRSRVIETTERWTAYEIVLDVWDEVFAWGYLLAPRDIMPGERRPVVVCQHGLEGLPEDVINRDPESRAWGPYKGFAAALADRGYVTFAPHNPYRGRDAFRGLQRKLNPLGKTLFSVIIGQHQRILEWLKTQPYVDSERIAFYGLSYGGKTAMRAPAVLEDYCLSICSADFNEWVWKNATIDWPGSYVFTGEYEIFEFDLGHRYNYAEMAALIAPRPFMVERGHFDGVGIDEYVAFEYAKVRRLYDTLGIGDRTEIEWFVGGHTINGDGTFQFLDRHLDWRPANSVE